MYEYRFLLFIGIWILEMWQKSIRCGCAFIHTLSRRGAIVGSNKRPDVQNAQNLFLTRVEDRSYALALDGKGNRYILLVWANVSGVGVGYGSGNRCA